jgi:hypothetical protein
MMRFMNSIRTFVEICLFRQGPADIAASNSLFKLSLLVYLLAGLAVNLLDGSWQMSLWVSVTELLLMLGFAGLVLKLAGKLPRYQQTVTALAGTGTLLAIVAWPLLWFFYGLEEQAQPSNLLLIGLMAIMLWSLMVHAHIYRQALDIRVGSAVALTIGYTILAVVITGLVMSGVA